MLATFADGFISGLGTALLAVAFAVVYLPTRVFYIALGGIFAFVPYIVYACLMAGFGVIASFGCGIFSGIILSVLAEAVLHGPLEQRKTSTDGHFVCSLGYYIILIQIVCLIWGTQKKAFRFGADAMTELGGVRLSLAQFSGAIAAILILTGFYLWVQHSKLGVQFRALADNPKELALAGLNINILRLLAFAVSGAFAAASAIIFASDLGFHPYSGLDAVLIALAAAMVGARWSLFGAVGMGIVIGIVRAQAGFVFSAQWQDPVTFLILIVVLWLQEVFSAKRRLEAVS